MILKGSNQLLEFFYPGNSLLMVRERERERNDAAKAKVILSPSSAINGAGAEERGDKVQHVSKRFEVAVERLVILCFSLCQLGDLDLHGPSVSDQARDVQRLPPAAQSSPLGRGECASVREV